MAEIVHRVPQRHRCYDELFSINYQAFRSLEYGTVVQCSCGRFYQIRPGNFFTSIWDGLNGRDHVAGGRNLWDRWVEVPGA